jgi:hypothetical protein
MLVVLQFYLLSCSTGLHPAARDKPHEAVAARAGASTGAAAAGRYMDE